MAVAAAAVLLSAVPAAVAQAGPGPYPAFSGGRAVPAPAQPVDEECSDNGDPGTVAGRPGGSGRSVRQWPEGIYDKADASDSLGRLTVDVYDPSGYDRKSQFGCWAKLPGERCDTRVVVLETQSDTPVSWDPAVPCRIVDGSWHSEYDDVTLTRPRQVDIDHIVPLKAAWGSGARSWTKEMRVDFANDIYASPQLIAVSASSNRSKGDKGPDTWMPGVKGHDPAVTDPADAARRCTYSEAWISVKYAWNLTVTQNEKDALTGALDLCP